MRRASSSVRPLSTPAAEPLPLGDPEVRRSLIRIVRRRVPEREVEDIVQETLADALSSSCPPRDPRALKGWLGGIARHKVVDFHRKACREDLTAEPEAGQGEAGAGEPGEGADLLRWAERSLPGGKTDRQTLEWMLREGEGEKLEQIAEGEQMPPERVRQRVARLRRHLREAWAHELAALATLGVLGALLVVWLRGSGQPEVVRDGERSPRRASVEPPEARGAREREAALERCRAGDHRGCLEGLDRAAGLDPAGDRSEVVRAARREAERALSPLPSPPPAPSATPAPGASSRFGKVTSGPRPHSDTAPAAPHRCVCTKGDPLCGCF